MSAPLGVVTEYKHLRELIAARRRELGLRQLEVDDLAGVQSGYTGKIECGLRSMGDMSMGALLGALGLHLIVMRTAGKHQSLTDQANASVKATRERVRNRSSLGGKARAKKLSPNQRRADARKAAKERWRKYRVKQAREKRAAEIAQRKSAEVETPAPLDLVGV